MNLSGIKIITKEVNNNMPTISTDGLSDLNKYTNPHERRITPTKVVFQSRMFFIITKEQEYPLHQYRQRIRAIPALVKFDLVQLMQK